MNHLISSQSKFLNKVITLLIITILISSCRTSKLPSDLTIDNAPTPPGTLKISNNLFFGTAEISNIMYLEFMYWTKHIFGSNSPEYTSILPDTTVWSQLNQNYISHDTFYLRHFAYWDYPVVGISYEQAKAFSNWRSDRYMELLLIKNGIIKPRTIIPKDSIFTTEKFFKGQYYGINPKQHGSIYPVYSLPDSATYQHIYVFADSLNAKNIKKCKKKACATFLITDYNCIENKTYRTKDFPYGPDPTMPTQCDHCPRNIIAHLKGNVREMTTTKGVYYGSSFIYSCKMPWNIFRKDIFEINSYTGFRNVCEYKQWKY